MASANGLDSSAVMSTGKAGRSTVHLALLEDPAAVRELQHVDGMRAHRDLEAAPSHPVAPPVGHCAQPRAQLVEGLVRVRVRARAKGRGRGRGRGRVKG